MTLPQDFMFAAEGDSKTAFYAFATPSGTYQVNWTESGKRQSLPYMASDVVRHIQNGSWQVLPESSSNISDITSVAETMGVLITEKNDASELEYEEIKALKSLRGLITRLLNDR